MNINITTDQNIDGFLSNEKCYSDAINCNAVIRFDRYNIDKSELRIISIPKGLDINSKLYFFSDKNTFYLGEVYKSLVIGRSLEIKYSIDKVEFVEENYIGNYIYYSSYVDGLLNEDENIQYHNFLITKKDINVDGKNKYY